MVRGTCIGKDNAVAGKQAQQGICRMVIDVGVEEKVTAFVKNGVSGQLGSGSSRLSLRIR